MQKGRGEKVLAYAVVALSLLLTAYLCWTSFSGARNQTQAVVPITAIEKANAPAVDEGSSLAGPESTTVSISHSSAAALTRFLDRLSDEPFIVPGEVILKFRFASDIADLRSRAHRLGLNVIWSDHRLSIARVAFADAAALVAELEANSEIYEQIGPNFTMAIPGLPPEPILEQDADNAGGNAPFRESMLKSIGAAQNRSDWGEGVTVAVVDSGIEAHPSLDPNAISRIDLSSSAEIHGHGTAMASLIAGRTFPAEGIAPASTLLDIRVTDDQGRSNTGLVAEAIMTAIDQRADVINLSLGSFGDSSLLREVVGLALERNIIVVAAAGNEQLTQLVFPAAYDGVISVGAVDAENTQAYFSNSGDTLTLSAPGVGIISAYGNEELVLGSGTSQATAITSGVVAALLSRGNHARDVQSILEKNAFQTGAPREQVGAGVIRIP